MSAEDMVVWPTNDFPHVKEPGQERKSERSTKKSQVPVTRIVAEFAPADQLENPGHNDVGRKQPDTTRLECRERPDAGRANDDVKSCQLSLPPAKNTPDVERDKKSTDQVHRRQVDDLADAGPGAVKGRRGKTHKNRGNSRKRQGRAVSARIRAPDDQPDYNVTDI